jgi:probable rRNA maturation factor
MAADIGTPDPRTPEPRTPERAAPLVDLVCEDDRWEAAGIAEVAERAARAALAAADLPAEGREISLLAAGDARVAELNAAFRARARPTNVLSWPAAPQGRAQAGEPILLGDIALAYETCAAEAEAAGIPLADHLAHLVVHGVLHLAGHDHEDDAEAETMEALEAKALASIGVSDPYRR